MNANAVLAAALPGPGQGGSPVSSFLHSLWSGFNDVLAFTANLWQNIDGLVFSAVAVYLFIRLTKSVLGHDESTIKTSTSFDYLGAFPRESDHKVYRLEDVWKLPFHEKTVRACFRQTSEEQPFLCIPNGAVWLALHDFYSGTRNDAVPKATDLRRDDALHRVSHILGITFGNYEMRQARIEDLAAPKLLDILRDPVREFQKAALSSRDLETARQLALIELAAIVCWKAPHLLVDALMEPELNREALLRAHGRSPIEKKLNLEAALQTEHKAEFQLLARQGRNLGRLFLLNRRASCEWLNSLQSPDGVENAPIPALAPEEQEAIEHLLQAREKFQPWTHHLVETISALPYVKRRFPYREYVQQVGRLEADGWLVRVYVNHAGDWA
ncbi:MAG TPA: hypothetical protein VNT26_02610 [Candidatus Sulfotelmatobacter sp.]|nr:hypothetical protein [Candidatus Sulfotelmatobacter sp.]